MYLNGIVAHAVVRVELAGIGLARQTAVAARGFNITLETRIDESLNLHRTATVLRRSEGVIDIRLASPLYLGEYLVSFRSSLKVIFLNLLMA